MARKRTVPQHPFSGTGEQEELHIPLDRDRIVRTALRVLNEFGLKELSMRKIADELQVKTASLYYHVKDKDQLLQLIGDKISEEMDRPDPDLPWQEQLIQWGHAFRRVLHRYRDAVDLFNGGIAMGYHRLLQIERLYQIFASAGFADGHIPWMASMVKNHVLGFVAEEVRLKGMAGSGEEAQAQLSEEYARFFRSLPREQFPNMIRLASHTTGTGWQEEFEFGLDVLMDGFRQRLTD